MTAGVSQARLAASEGPGGNEEVARSPPRREILKSGRAAESEGPSSSSPTASPPGSRGSGPQPLHVPGPRTLDAGPGARAGSQAQAELSQEPTPQRAGAGPGFRACPRGREGPQGSPPRLSRQLGSAPAVLCPPCARDTLAQSAHSRGRPLPRAVLFLRLPSGHLAG